MFTVIGIWEQITFYGKNACSNVSEYLFYIGFCTYEIIIAKSETVVILSIARTYRFVDFLSDDRQNTFLPRAARIHLLLPFPECTGKANLFHPHYSTNCARIKILYVELFVTIFTLLFHKIKYKNNHTTQRKFIKIIQAISSNFFGSFLTRTPNFLLRLEYAQEPMITQAVITGVNGKSIQISIGLPIVEMKLGLIQPGHLTVLPVYSPFLL